jgi:hypothetical protein
MLLLLLVLFLFPCSGVGSVFDAEQMSVAAQDMEMKRLKYTYCSEKVPSLSGLSSTFDDRDRWDIVASLIKVLE